jgi:hypothetical protein
MRLPQDNSLAVPMIRRAVELGINYFETAIVYTQNRSEVQVGLGLKGMRDDVYVSTKSRAYRKGEIHSGGVRERDSTGEDFRNNLRESLWKLGTDRVDFYQFHSLTLENLPIAMAEGGPLGVLKEAKDEGLIDHIGFTTHDTPSNIMKMLDTGEFESVTVYHNILRTRGKSENPLPAIEHARKLGIGVIVMGPLGGGVLGTPIEKLQEIIPGTRSQVELAFRYLLSIPGVTTPISGMTRMNDVEENARIASEAKPLSSDEMEKAKEVIDRYSDLVEQFCTGCGYCQPCPQGVRIPTIFRLMNFYAVYGVKDWAKEQYNFQRTFVPKGSADLCIECGECEEKCPQKIMIREDLKKAHKLLTESG